MTLSLECPKELPFEMRVKGDKGRKLPLVDNISETILGV